MNNNNDIDIDNTVTLLDYGGGNVCSVRNALKLLNIHIIDVKSVDDIINARRLLFPGVGAYPQAVNQLQCLGYINALKQYILSGKPFFGMCLGMQILFDGSTEIGQNINTTSENISHSNHTAGLSIFNGICNKFTTNNKQYPVPHIGWNSLILNNKHYNYDNNNNNELFSGEQDEKYYFVHSFCAQPNQQNEPYILTYTDYGNTRFISSIYKNNVLATQFHPEKSSNNGIRLLEKFIKLSQKPNIQNINHLITNNTVQQTNDINNSTTTTQQRTELAKRIIACLDVRSNDSGDLVVTKGDSYNVRDTLQNNNVRNLGKPVELAQRYYMNGADEITFLNITSFRDEVLNDSIMLQLLEQVSKTVFVPLCIGGGIRDYTDSNGKFTTALDVASAYFRAGADKISIGSDAVYAAEQYYNNNCKCTGKTSIEQISYGYGAQAVVVSIDPKKVYVNSPNDTRHYTVHISEVNNYGPNNEQYVWYQCTVKGGRELRDIDVVELSIACEALGAGELLVNSIDSDGQQNGYDIDLLNMICNNVNIPVIASSGAGSVKHFIDVFNKTNVNAALAAGIFHRNQVSINDVKNTLIQNNIPVRIHDTESNVNSIVRR